MTVRFLLAALALLSAPSTTAAQVELPAPVRAPSSDADVEAGPRGLRLVLDPDLHAELARQRHVRLVGFPLPNGGFVDLLLEQRAWRGVVGEPRVDRQPRMDLFLSHDLTTWKGEVAGRPGSRVFLGFSRHGTNGFLRFGDELFLVRGRPDAEGRFGRGHFEVIDEQGGRALDGFRCGTAPADPPPHSPSVADGAGEGFLDEFQHARVAVSVDWWVHLNWGFDLEAEVSYIYSLLWAISEFYLDELSNGGPDFFLTFPYVEFWTDQNDPWDECDLGIDNKDDVLVEFEDKWEDIFDDEKVHLALLLCGRTIGGGKASGAGLSAEICPGTFAGLGEHSVCGNINSEMDLDPPTQGLDTWEFIVITHELGHNLGGVHTHEQDIDDCDEDDSSCPEGTIMSYCHTCSTMGVGNIDLSFHPTTKADILSKLDDQDCLPLIGLSPIYVAKPFSLSGFPKGTQSAPYDSLFEGLRLATVLGGPPSNLRVQGTLPGAAPGVQEWPTQVLLDALLFGSGIVIEGWGSGATVE